MLRLTLELIPRGNEKAKKTLGVLTLENLGVEAEQGDYKADIELRADAEYLIKRACFIQNHDRGQHAWYLVRKALNSLLGPR